MSYRKVRSMGGMKGLGSGAKSYNRGVGQVKSYVNQSARRARTFVPRFKTRYSGSSRYVGRETKTVDFAFTGAYADPYVVDTNPSPVMNFNSDRGAIQALMIQQGAGSFQRVGNQCQLKSIRLRFRLFNLARLEFST